MLLFPITSISCKMGAILIFPFATTKCLDTIALAQDVNASYGPDQFNNVITMYHESIIDEI